MLRKTTVAIALASLFCATGASAVALQQSDNGDYIRLYGEVGVGGHFATNPDYNHDEFYDTKGFVDDSFATMGVKGERSNFIYRLELDYQRRNWLGGDGEFELAIDKMYLGYRFDEYQWVQFGLTDTAFDRYDHYGDFTFNKAVETGEAGDQENTIKYEAKFNNVFYGVSYSYDGKHKSGAAQGDIVNGYVGWKADMFSGVFGLESRAGSDGISKYGEQKLMGFGVRVEVMPKLTLGFNAFLEDEDLATRKSGDVYLAYETFRNVGATLSAKYDYSQSTQVIASINHEEYESWDIEGPNFDYTQLPYAFGKERRWASLGANYYPAKGIVLSIEGRVGEAPEAAYAYARMYF
ncbi:porin [Shewanella intestini]|uniref:Porin n=1 Tax=Shewanella intestini TaxID=2017544 RepID=A0ABS5I0C5_9GAMM|nr:MULTISPECIES: porin [Shewanella]MBR9727371.1 porin [Shewanella intestini]MRG35579.1 porin [Shewanella sp. XMDDZSB0408]